MMLLFPDSGSEVPLLAIDNQHISLKLKAQRKKIPQCDADGTAQSKIGLDTDAARDAYTLFSRSNLREHFHSAIDGFQAVLHQCPHDHAHRAAALSNLAHAILCGFTRTIDNDIDRAIHLFCSALTLRPRGHIDHPLSILDLCHALCKRHSHKKEHADLREAADLYCSILPLCVEGSHLHQVVFDTSGIPYVIEQCNALPSDPSGESISLRRIVLELCLPRHQHRAYTLNKLAGDLYRHSTCARLQRSITAPEHGQQSSLPPPSPPHHALIRDYNIFYSPICRKKVPIVVVVTGLENEPDMESWWSANGKEFKSRGISDVFTRCIEESSEILSNLVVNSCSDWAVDDIWFKQSFCAKHDQRWWEQRKVFAVNFHHL
ncbi:hypothetical protein BDR05DRAFT_1005996 [Suillus weaverae]|nr:hypothetical protein BDR05DRAFT_1005996 [Suillus weaverae]